jgi:hypothetical protein
MLFQFLSRQSGGVTIVTDSGVRVTLIPGFNELTDEQAKAVTSSKLGQFFLEQNTLIPQKVEPVEEPKKYKPLTPTISKLTPLPTIGKTTAASIVSATPEGGYTSPEQLISINELTVSVEAVAALFE